MIRVLPYPWSLLDPRGSRLASSSLEDCEAAAPFNPETITFFVRDEGEPGNRRPFATTRLSSDVVFDPTTKLKVQRGTLLVPSLPLEPLDRWYVHVEREECVIPIEGAMRRAEAWEEPENHNADDVFLRDAIDLLSGYFREAIALTHETDDPEIAGFANQPIVRLDWKSIWERWKKVGTGNEPRMAQIVEIAFGYIAQLRDVCERPRRMLIRQRELVPLGRVQELDAACLRNLIQRPGRTIPQKAGPRQEILAVTRRETVDTAENRVIRDFLRLCQHRAGAYVRENHRAPKHRKVQAVKGLRMSCDRLNATSPIAAAEQLVGVARPNYVLQKDRRYHPLWVQYDKLRREEKAIDSVWPWSRILWAEFIRGVVTGFLHSDDGRNISSWQPAADIPSYLWAEQTSGAFLPALSISNRLLHRNGQLQMFVVHPAHANLCPGLEELLPRLGVELALAIYPTSGNCSSPIALLCIYSVLSLKTNTEQRTAMITSLQAALDNVSNQNPSLEVRGLLLRGEWPGDQSARSSRHGRLDCLAAPVAIPAENQKPFWFFDFPEMLTVLLDEVVG